MIPTRENGVGNGGQFLPPGWEEAYDFESNRYYYVDHNTKRTTWLNPTDKWKKPSSFSQCNHDQLPYGWERVEDPQIGVYYTDHIAEKNQWSNPVSDWHRRNIIVNQHHYSNSHHILSMQQSANSLESNNRTISPITTGKPDTSLQTSDIERSATSLNNSTSLDTEIIESTQSNTSTRGSKYDAGLLDIMDNCFGRDSRESVEV